MSRKMRSTACRLLGLPNGLHFPSLPKLEWLWYCEGVLEWIDVRLRRTSLSTVSPAWYACLVSPLDLLLTIFRVSFHPASDRPPNTTGLAHLFFPCTHCQVFDESSLHSTVTPNRQFFQRISTTVPHDPTRGDFGVDVRKCIGNAVRNMPVFSPTVGLTFNLPKHLPLFAEEAKQRKIRFHEVSLPEVTKKGTVS